MALDAIDSLSDVCRQRELREPQQATQCCIDHMMALHNCTVPHGGCHRAINLEGRFKKELLEDAKRKRFGRVAIRSAAADLEATAELVR